MMTVHTVRGGNARGYADYLAGEPLPSRRGAYHLGRDGGYAASPGRWHGRGADALDLNGEWTRADLMAVWEGRDPRTGRIEVRRSATGEHVAAVDCTFSAPKSVSVIWAMSEPAGRTRIDAAQTDAVKAAVDHVESTVPLQRRRVAGSRLHERSDGIVVTMFRHHTARLSTSQEDENAVPDPHVHDHVAIANMAQRPATEFRSGTMWRAIDSRELYRVAAEAGAVYRAELASGLQRLGFQVERGGRYFEVAGVTDRVRAEFSTRARDVERARRAFITTHGRVPSIPERRALTLRTRRAKSCEPADPFPAWRDRAEAAGFRVSDVPCSGVDRNSTAAWNDAVADVVADLTDPSRDHSLTRSGAVFDTWQLRRATAEAAQGRVPGHQVAALIDSVSESPELIRLDDRHWTTGAMRDAERYAVLVRESRARGVDEEPARQYHGPERHQPERDHERDM
jgi:conjugative relaxase-like TrwC/TraI family protein